MASNASRFPITRRRLLGQAGLAGLAMATTTPAAWAQSKKIDLLLPGGIGERPISTDFPQKGAMILQRSRPPLLETPFDVFGEGVFTPNNRFYVRWHWSAIPTQVDVDTFKLAVRGHVSKELSLTLKDVQALPQVEMAAVNQCSGNSRGFFEPRVAGAQWANGAMGNARWTGVRLADVLAHAGVKPGAVQVRFKGMDEPPVAGAPKFAKSLDLAHASDGEVMIAYGMNGEQLPLLNGFPLRLIVPGWYATYWIKMLNDIEVLDQPDDNYWTKSAYRIPDTPYANVKPGEMGVKTVPISKMVPRSFVTNIRPDETIRVGAPTAARGIAFGGDTGVARVDLSSDGGKTWRMAELGEDAGKYGFRRWQAELTLSSQGAHRLMVRATNSNGMTQPAVPNWNSSGFMRNVVEAVNVVAV